MKMDRQTGVESSAAFFAPTKAVASLSAHNSNEHLSSTGPSACGFYSIGCASPDTTGRARPVRAHDVTTAPPARRYPLVSAHCLNSASLSLSASLSRLLSPLASNGGRSPRRASSTGSKKTTGHHSSLLGALAGLHASKNASSSSIARTYLHSHAITCNHMQSHAIRCNQMQSDCMQSDVNQMQLEALDIPTSRHPVNSAML